MTITDPRAIQALGDRPTGRAASWTLLILCGGASWSLSVAHALTQAGTSPSMAWAGILVGTLPVACVAILSHMASSGHADRVERFLVWGVMVLSMGMSLSAQAATVDPYMDWILHWVFPIMSDVSTVVGLRRLMRIGARTEVVSTVSTPVSTDMDTVAKQMTDLGLSMNARGQLERVSMPVVSTPVVSTPVVSMDKPVSTMDKPVSTPKKVSKTSSGGLDNLDRARLALVDNPTMDYKALAMALGVSTKTGSRLLKRLSMDTPAVDTVDAAPVSMSMSMDSSAQTRKESRS